MHYSASDSHSCSGRMRWPRPAFTSRSRTGRRLSSAFYVRSGQEYRPTELTRGPWDDKFQHGGPPAALLGTAMEAMDPANDWMVVRAAFWIMKCLPLESMTLTTRMLRKGHSTQTIAGTVIVGGRKMMHGQLLRIRKTNLPIAQPELPLPTEPKGEPDGCLRMRCDPRYNTGMDILFARGAFLTPGPGTAWFRMLGPLVEGESPSPLARVLIAADSG